MQTLLVKEILDAVKGKLISGAPDDAVTEFSLDSRTVKPGQVFIAIKGVNFDGHQFLSDVINKGAGGIIIGEGYGLPEILPCLAIRVKDTVTALGDIAGIHRKKFKGPVIAVTGTAGKTTTKEFIGTVLKRRFRVHKTQGTLNNHIGVPMTLMALDNALFDTAVIELGMNRLGEIKELAGITKPDVGIITNIGPGHLEHLGSISNVIKAKAELLEVIEKEGLVILNMDNEYYPELKRYVRSRLITVGRNPLSDFQAEGLGIDKQTAHARFRIIAKPKSGILEIALPVIGMHNIYPALFAAAVGYGLGMRPSEIIEGLENVSLPEMRMEIHEVAGAKIIDDSYNANPMSMSNALDIVGAMDTKGRKIFVCGDMLELGKESARFHEEIGMKVVEKAVNKLITIGKLSADISKTALLHGMKQEDVRHCTDNREAIEVLAHWLEPSDTILIKGSRLNHMEEIVKGIKEYYAVFEQLIV